MKRVILLIGIFSYLFGQGNYVPAFGSSYYYELLVFPVDSTFDMFCDPICNFNRDIMVWDATMLEKDTIRPIEEVSFVKAEGTKFYHLFPEANFVKVVGDEHSYYKIGKNGWFLLGNVRRFIFYPNQKGYSITFYSPPLYEMWFSKTSIPLEYDEIIVSYFRGDVDTFFSKTKYTSYVIDEGVLQFSEGNAMDVIVLKTVKEYNYYDEWIDRITMYNYFNENYPVPVFILIYRYSRAFEGPIVCLFAKRLIIEDMTTSITKKHKGIVKIFPNPVSDYMLITSVVAIKEVEIFNALGEKVYSVPGSNKKVINVNMADLSPGIYLVKVNGRFYKVLKK